MNQISDILLGQILIKEKLITQEQLDLSLAEQERTKGLLGAILLKFKFVDQAALFPILARQMGVDFISLKELDIPQQIIERIPAQLAVFYKVVPIAFENGLLSIALSNPRDIHHLDG